MAEPNPVLVEVLRGDSVESLHRGSAVVADAAGRVVAAWGDASRPAFPRSALKPIQALPLVESGAAAAFGLGPEELALAAASHTGEAIHVERVRAWLERIGLGPDALECGAHAPVDDASAKALMRADMPPSPLHNNCSGKHAGFLTLARHLGVPTEGYIRPDHPVQQLVSEAIAGMTGAALQRCPCGVDGCGIPAFALPLSALATGMARMAAPEGLPPARRDAAYAITASMLQHPRLTSGTGWFATRVMEVAPRLVLKGGAEGVYAAILPEKGWGMAVKIDDGARRAAEVAMGALLTGLELLDAAERAALAELLEPPLHNVAGKVVGAVRAAAAGPGAGTRSAP